MRKGEKERKQVNQIFCHFLECPCGRSHEKKRNKSLLCSGDGKGARNRKAKYY